MPLRVYQPRFHCVYQQHRQYRTIWYELRRLQSEIPTLTPAVRSRVLIIFLSVRLHAHLSPNSLQLNVDISTEFFVLIIYKFSNVRIISISSEYVDDYDKVI